MTAELAEACARASHVACADGTAFGIERLQRPGKKILTAREFQNGERLKPGEHFG